MLYCTKAYCIALYPRSALYNTVLYCTILYMLYCAVLYYVRFIMNCVVLYYTLLWYTVLYYTTLYCTVCFILHGTVLCYTVLYGSLGASRGSSGPPGFGNQADVLACIICPKQRLTWKVFQSFLGYHFWPHPARINNPPRLSNPSGGGRTNYCFVPLPSAI